MKDLTKKLVDLIDTCVLRIEKVEADKAKNASERNRLEVLKNEVELANKTAVEGIERLNSLKAKHEDLNDAKRLKAELQTEIKRYKEMQRELESKFEEAEQLKKDGFAELEDKKIKFDKEIDKLNKDKKDFRDKVMKAISSDLKSKGVEL